MWASSQYGHGQPIVWGPYPSKAYTWRNIRALVIFNDNLLEFILIAEQHRYNRIRRIKRLAIETWNLWYWAILSLSSSLNQLQSSSLFFFFAIQFWTEMIFFKNRSLAAYIEAVHKIPFASAFCVEFHEQFWFNGVCFKLRTTRFFSIHLRVFDREFEERWISKCIM